MNAAINKVSAKYGGKEKLERNMARTFRPPSWPK